ncbi:GH92 family glycosyl hydrolase [candidate division KSB1 bacterium]|nr:GH92 family glycosyl hydrolase [candidate division KSB1 bacterium]
MKVCLGLLCILIIMTACTSPKQEDQLVNFINPKIGTDAHGHTFPGATRPFGMVQLSPDTGTEGWDWCSGYHYSDSSIIGFSHTHLSGTGRPELLDILLMPTTGGIQFDAGSKENPDAGYRSRFSHETETAQAGYYAVVLDDYAINAELTTSRRAGFHRYTAHNAENIDLVIDLAHSQKTDSISHCYLKIVNDTLVVGSHKSRGWGVGDELYWVEHEVFFAARLSQPIKESVLWADGKIYSDADEIQSTHVKVALTIPVKTNKQLLVKVGLSAVDVNGALKNVDAEIPKWDFDAVRADAEGEWRNMLDKVQVTSNDRALKETFYTAMYHACIAPFTYMDVDRRYCGFDKKIHTADGFTNLTGLSLWDTFRAANPLYTILAPQLVTDLVNSALAQYDEYGLLPVWPLCNSETNCKIGYHAVPVIVDAYFKGFRGFNVDKAYQAMKTSAMQDDFGIKFLKEYGYIPADLENKSVSKTLEYAFDDWCLAQMAHALGKQEDYVYFKQRSQAFRNVFEPNSGFMRGRRADGFFVEPFDPTFASYGPSDFIEGNAWQYMWFVPHDVAGLIELLGGDEAFVDKLDQLFGTETSSSEGKPIDITGLIGEYAHGNEPSHHTAYLYTFAGQPWKSQQRLNEIMTTLYTNQPDGLCGNEDMGQMSAWYIFSAIGFYPVNPADGRYVFGTPQFERVEIAMPSGKVFTVKTTGLAEKNIYIQSVKLNGQEYDKGYIEHKAMLDGGTLEFVMGSDPGKRFMID